MIHTRHSFGGWPYLLLPLLMAAAWVAYLGYPGLNGQDAYDYLRIAQAWARWSPGADFPIMVEHPHGYPIAGLLVGRVFGSELIGLRIVGALGLALIIAAVGDMLRNGNTERSRVGTYLLLTVALSPFLLRYALVVMSDVPAIALLLAAFACALRWVGKRRAIWLLGALACALLAVSFRLATLPVVAVLMAWCWWRVAGRAWWRWLPVVPIVFGALWVAGAFGPDVSPSGPLSDWSLLNYFRTELHSDDGSLHYTVPNLLYVLGVLVHPGLLPIGVLLLPFFRTEDLRPLHAQLALSGLVVYLLFIAGMPFQNDRVLLLAQPLAVLLLYPAFLRALAALRSLVRRPGWLIAAVVVLQTALFVRAMLPFVEQHRVELDLAARLRSLSARYIYTHGMGAALAHLLPETGVRELWYAPIERFTSGAYVVVKPLSLEAQWQGTPPGINWERIQDQGLDQVVAGPDGWIIARVR